jgi:hypothetical protein
LHQLNGCIYLSKTDLNVMELVCGVNVPPCHQCQRLVLAQPSKIDCRELTLRLCVWEQLPEIDRLKMVVMGMVPAQCCQRCLHGIHTMKASFSRPSRRLNGFEVLNSGYPCKQVSSWCTAVSFQWVGISGANEGEIEGGAWEWDCHWEYELSSQLFQWWRDQDRAIGEGRSVEKIEVMMVWVWAIMAFNQISDLIQHIAL